MPDAAAFGIFLAAAVVLAITPGPGIFYVLARSIKGGRREGYASAALGVSAVLAASATAFSVVKYIGAAYLIYLGVRALLSKESPIELDDSAQRASKRAFYQGITTEILNPKTALFFLAFIPQFVNPHGVVVLEFLLLGSISVLLNSSMDILVATLAGPIGTQLKKRAKLRQGQRMFSGISLIALGAYVALSGEKNGG
ncbi:MAG: LysE family translocator [Chloroflexota bacterium]